MANVLAVCRYWQELFYLKECWLTIKMDRYIGNQYALIGNIKINLGMVEMMDVFWLDPDFLWSRVNKLKYLRLHQINIPIPYFPRLETLEISYGHLLSPDTSIQHLPRLKTLKMHYHGKLDIVLPPTLTELHLSNTFITDKAFKSISNCKSLTRLDTSWEILNNLIFNSGLNCSSLIELNLSDPHDANFDGFSNLKHLSIHRHFTDENLVVENVPKLTHISVYNWRSKAKFLIVRNCPSIQLIQSPVKVVVDKVCQVRYWMF